jgi:hypothetical protein
MQFLLQKLEFNIIPLSKKNIGRTWTISGRREMMVYCDDAAVLRCFSIPAVETDIQTSGSQRRIPHPTKFHFVRRPDIIRVRPICPVLLLGKALCVNVRCGMLR